LNVKGVLRPIDFSAAEIEYPGGYRGQVLYLGERCVVIATFVPAGVSGPPRHVHPDGDQTYFMISGEITIELGSRVQVVSPGSSIFIPSGLPHRNWNDSGEPEVHLEVIAPGQRIRRALSQPTDARDAPGLASAVAHVSEEDLASCGTTTLTGPSRGSQHAALRVQQSGCSGPPEEFQVHSVDRFYLCLEGQLGLQVGLDDHVADAQTLAVVPAGVPHRMWNPSSGEHRYLSVTVGGPEDDLDHQAPAMVRLAAGQ